MRLAGGNKKGSTGAEWGFMMKSSGNLKSPIIETSESEKDGKREWERDGGGEKGESEQKGEEEEETRDCKNAENRDKTRREREREDNMKASPPSIYRKKKTKKHCW